MATSLQRIRAGIVDGRSRTPRYIQKQLAKVHDVLTKTTSQVHQAIIRDTGCSSVEAWFEIHVTLQAVKDQFEATNFHQLLDQEYCIAHGKSNQERRLPFGCVYVIPAQNNRLNSVIQPIVAAIAAGNCVVVEMNQTLSEVDKLLREILLVVMDKDTFAIVEQRPDTKFFDTQVVVANAASYTDGLSNITSRLIQSPSTKTVAIVDRSANISEAAKHIVRARFRFSGRSPYAPDIVLVNEFALKEFCQAAVRVFTDGLSDAVNGSATARSQPTGSAQKELQQTGAITLVSGSKGSIQLVKTRERSFFTNKITEPILVVNAITSLDDAIDTANSSNTSLLAGYYFADPKAAKYLSQFIVSDLSCTNFIPPELLVGPPAPSNYPVSVSARYSSEMFSFPSPELIMSSITTTTRKAVLSAASQSISSSKLVTLLDGQASKAELEALKSATHSPLADMGEPKGTTVGFFEQGLFTAVAIEGTILIGIIGVAASYTVPAVLRRLR